MPYETDVRHAVGNSFVDEWLVVGRIKELKQFIKKLLVKQKKELVGRLRMEKKLMSGHFRMFGEIESTRDKIKSGYNQAVSELNKRLDEELK